MNRSGRHLTHIPIALPHPLPPPSLPHHHHHHQTPPNSPTMSFSYHQPRRRRRIQPQTWGLIDLLWMDYIAAMTNTNTGSATQPLRPINMNTYPTQQPSRQPPRLQNVNKSGLGNGAGAGWGGFGLPGFGGLGGAQGLASQGRPGQLSGFAQVMGGGGGQAPIDMR